MKSLLLLLLLLVFVDSAALRGDVDGSDEPRYFNSITSPFIQATQHIINDVSDALKQPVAPPRDVRLVLTEISTIAKQLLKDLQKPDELSLEDQVDDFPEVDQEEHRRRNLDLLGIFANILPVRTVIKQASTIVVSAVERSKKNAFVDVDGSDEPRTFLEAMDQFEHRNLDSSDVKDTLMMPLKVFISFWERLLGKRNFITGPRSCTELVINLQEILDWNILKTNRRNLDAAGVITDIKDVALMPMKIIISFWDNLLGKRGFAGDMDGEELIRTLKEALEQVSKDPQNQRRNFDVLDVITGIKDVVLTPPRLIISILDDIFGTRGFITDKGIDKERVEKILESHGFTAENSDWLEQWIAILADVKLPKVYTDHIDNGPRDFAAESDTDWFSNWLRSIVAIVMKPSSNRFFSEEGPRKREFWGEIFNFFDDLGKSPIGRVIGAVTGADVVVEVVKEVVELANAPREFVEEEEEPLEPEAVELLEKIDLDGFDINRLSDTDQQDLIATFQAISIGLGHRNFEADSLLEVQEGPPEKREFLGFLLKAVIRIFKKPFLKLLRHAFKLIKRGKTVLKTIGKGAKESLKTLIGKMKPSRVPRILERYGDVTTMTEDWDGVEMRREVQYVNTDDGKGLFYTLEDAEGTKIEEGFMAAEENPLEEIFKKQE